jgi:hypothetical protein
MPIEKQELEGQLTRLTALLAAKTAEMHQIDGAKAFCEHLLDMCHAPEVQLEPPKTRKSRK